MGPGAEGEAGGERDCRLLVLLFVCLRILSAERFTSREVGQGATEGVSDHGNSGLVTEETRHCHGVLCPHPFLANVSGVCDVFAARWCQRGGREARGERGLVTEDIQTWT